jgi:sugar phosphate isomerase/epimerase
MSVLDVGAFARIWKSPSVTEIAESMAAAGLSCAQWNFSAMGLPTVSSEIPGNVYEDVAGAFAKAGMSVWGLSVTHNNTHPDPGERARLQAAAVQMIRRAPLLGVTAVTICAGSCNESGWEFHPDNVTGKAWDLMRECLDPLLAAADEAGVDIGIEPEAGSIIRDAQAARRLLDALGPGTRAKIILDAWNLAAGQADRSSADVLGEAFELLGPDTVGLQAKDPRNQAFASPTVDYAVVASLQARHCPGTSVIIQNVAEESIAEVAEFLRSAWRSSGAEPG